MVQSLVDYVKKEVAQGFSVDQIRVALVKYGYSQIQIDEAINSYNSQLNQKGPVHQTTTVKKPFSKNILFIVGGIIILAILIISTIYFIDGQDSFTKQETTINFEAITTTIRPGQEIIFNKKATSNVQTKISLSYQLLNKKDNIILTDYENLDIKNSITAQTKIQVPSETKLGDYKLKIISKYNGQENIEFIQIKLFEDSSLPSCFDNMLNQNEEKIDCGGLCDPCRTCPTNCDDQDVCTEDFCNEQTDFKCRHTVLDSCRSQNSNNQQNSTEQNTQNNQQTQSPYDATQQATNSQQATTLKTVRSELYNLILTDPVAAGQTCNKITETLEKDTCFKTVAELSNSSNFCNYVERSLTKDTCYMKFVMKNNEFQHCTIIGDDYLKDSCETLKNLKEMEAQYLAIRQQSLS